MSPALIVSDTTGQVKMLRTQSIPQRHAKRPQNAPQRHLRHVSGEDVQSLDNAKSDRAVGTMTRVTVKGCKCKVCNARFFPAKPAKYCSDACRQKAHRQRKAKKRPQVAYCAHCRSAFAPVSKTHKFCHPNCRKASHAIKRRKAVEVYAAVEALPLDAAHDAADIGGITAITAILAIEGFIYDYKLRRWA